MKIRINNYNWDNWDIVECYRYLEELINTKADECGINLDLYYNPVAANFINIEGVDRDDIRVIFKELVYHSQNRNGMNNIKMNPGTGIHRESIAQALCNYNPRAFLDTHPENRLDSICDEMGIGRKQPSYLFIKTAINIARFLTNPIDNIQSRDDITNLFGQWVNQPSILYREFKRRIPSGFGVAMTFDFLKEFDNTVFDLPKPDIHIKQFIAAVTGITTIENASKIDDLSAVDFVVKMKNELNRRGIDVSSYKLDKIIYLLLANNFYALGEGEQDTLFALNNRQFLSNLASAFPIR